MAHFRSIFWGCGLCLVISLVLHLIAFFYDCSVMLYVTLMYLSTAFVLFGIGGILYLYSRMVKGDVD